ncbi:MAG TPA: hypothetical protein VME69_12330 [Methylocella sp.]|nr:hypothetical protein [Methylocella sp.]
MFLAGLSCVASSAAFAQEQGASAGILGVMNPRTGVFKALPKSESPEAAVSAVGGTVKTTINGTIQPPLSSTNKIFCYISITITAGDGVTYSYEQDKNATVPATISENSLTCNSTIEYLAHLVVAGTSPQLSISSVIFAIDSSIPSSAIYGSQSRYMDSSDLGVSIPLPPNGKTTSKTFSVLF